MKFQILLFCGIKDCILFWNLRFICFFINFLTILVNILSSVLISGFFVTFHSLLVLFFIFIMSLISVGRSECLILL